MPLPFILGGLAIATAATVKKAYDGYQDKSEADTIVAKAKANYESSRAKLESANNDLQNKLNNLGELYLKVGQDFNEFQTIAQKLIEQTDTSVAKKIKAVIPDFKIPKILTLAAGRLGMAGGTINLVVVIDPAPVIPPVFALAWAFASQAADALANAKKIRNEVNDFVDQSDKTINELQYAESYIDSIHDSMQEIYAQFQEYLDDLKVVELMVRRKSTDEINKNEEIIRIVENGYALAAILADIISTPIFRVKTLDGQPVVDEDGMAVFETTPNGNMALNELEMREVLKNAESRI